MTALFRVTSLAVAVLLVACGCGPAGSSGTRAPTGQADATPSVGHPTPSAAGTADPDGRIVFGRITREDPLYGQVVALYAIDPDGTDEVQLTDGESAFPEWSPDGRRLAYTARVDDGSWQIATMAPDGSDVKILTSGAGIHEVPSWTPDGSTLLYGYSPVMPDNPEFRTSLWQMNADGSDQKLVGDPETFDVEPEVSPDGESVLFSRLTIEGGNQSSTLMIRDLGTGAQRSLSAAGSAPNHATWSPDGKSIIYNLGRDVAGPGIRDQIEQVAADGSGKATVLFPGTTTTAGFKPVYSPNGKHILFGCFGFDGQRGDGACLMDSDGSNVRVLADLPDKDENHFDWGVAAP